MDETGDSSVTLPPVCTPVKARVLGVLLEKEFLTPAVYPMTLNGLTTACNQTSNRFPVVDYGASVVEQAALSLKAKGLVRLVHPSAGERATKYRQVAGERLGLDLSERALLCLLLLRGPQTAAELKSRTERMTDFTSTSAVEELLAALTARGTPLVARTDRLPGQKEPRWIQLLEEDVEGRAAVMESGRITPVGGTHAVDELERRVAHLEERLDDLVAALGDLVPGQAGV